ncbi:MAG: hypothetical protein B7Z78_00585 [Rhodospirillales bacterium 20-60-12]|nr:MAG: hypothetical protein B7Z78_00585 [Rhodospirillales bacterium 20-60-12]HQT66112.1 hypothetical protein [Acetobacteraceae bacterium]
MDRTEKRQILLASTALTAAFLLAGGSAHAQAPLAPTTTPVGGTVVGGSASISQSAGQTDITQTSQRTAIDW